VDGNNNIRPLIVELDSTLMYTETLWESCLLFIKKYPLKIFSFIKWAVIGKSYLNHQLSKKVLPEVSLLPHNEGVEKVINIAKNSGRKTYLMTDTNQRIADAVSKSAKLFTKVIVSNDKKIANGNKLEIIRDVVGSTKFDYIGNSRSDTTILKEAHTSYIVARNNRFPKSFKKLNNIEIISTDGSFFRRWIKALRVHQWSKNILIFLALLMSHRILEVELFIKSTIAFFSFSFSASAVYILNDLFDLEADRRHPSKKHRPFAEGQISIKNGIFAVPILLISSILLSAIFLPSLFTIALFTYLIATTCYSLILKEILFVDVILLGALYTLRIIAGGLATGIEVSSWLLGFSGFFFLSLAFMKRYTDLILFKKNSQEELFGRGYSVEDSEIVQKAGITSGFLSLIILALYITSDQVFVLYRQPLLLWLSIPIILYWLMNMWVVANRNRMTEDPIIYAVKDRISYITFTLLLLVIIAATIF